VEKQLSRFELKQLIWVYSQVQGDPDLLLRYAGSGYKIETMYRGIHDTIVRLQKELDAMPEETS
jgi:hypothetical protein